MINVARSTVFATRALGPQAPGEQPTGPEGTSFVDKVSHKLEQLVREAVSTPPTETFGKPSLTVRVIGYADGAVLAVRAVFGEGALPNLEDVIGEDFALIVGQSPLEQVNESTLPDSNVQRRIYARRKFAALVAQISQVANKAGVNVLAQWVGDP